MSQIKLIIGKISILHDKIQVPVRVRVSNRNVVMNGAGVFFKEGMIQKWATLTDPAGEARYVYEFDLSRSEEHVTISIGLINEPVEKLEILSLPKVEKSVRADVDDLYLFGYTDPKTGQSCIDVTVKDEHGHGLERKVQFFIQDPDCLFPQPTATTPNGALPPSTTLPYHEVTTDSEGSVIFLFPRKLKRGETIRVRGKISDVPGEGCDIEITRNAKKVIKLSLFDRFFNSTLGWIRKAKTRVNTPNVVVRRNWIIRLLLTITMLPLLLLSFISRIVRLNRFNRFLQIRCLLRLRSNRFRLTAPTPRVNRNWLLRLALTIASVPIYILRFFIVNFLKINSNNGRARLLWIALIATFVYCLNIGFGDMSFSRNAQHWQKYWWFGFFVAIPVVIMYTIVAMREELSELWITCTHSWRRKNKASVHDSRFERLLEYGGQIMSVGRVKRSPTDVVADASGAAVAAPAASKKMGFGSMFMSDITAEFAWDFLSKAAVKILKG